MEEDEFTGRLETLGGMVRPQLPAEGGFTTVVFEPEEQKDYPPAVRTNGLFSLENANIFSIGFFFRFSANICKGVS